MDTQKSLYLCTSIVDKFQMLEVPSEQRSNICNTK